METPFFSIIIPTYNQLFSIKDALNGVKIQSFKNYECIIVDDHSTEDYSLICSDLPRNFKYHRNKKNIGRVQNYRNAIVNLARGKYVIICDGDDYFVYNQMLEELHGFILQYNPILILSGMYIGREFLNSNLVVSKYKEYVTEINDSSTFFKDFLNEKIVFSHFGAVYSLEFALKLNFFKYNYLSADICSIMQLVNFGKVLIIKNAYGFWRRHDSQTTKQNSNFNLAKIRNIKIWKILYNLSDVKAGQFIELIFDRKLLNILYVANEEKFIAKKYLTFFIIFLYYPFDLFRLFKSKSKMKI